MSIVYQCIHCTRPILAPDELAGKFWHCPHENCSKVTHVPRWGIGQTIANHWRVRKIFQGGMGWVYIAQDMEAIQNGTFLQFAFKTFKDVSNPANVHRFLREAKRWIEVGEHDHVVRALFAREMEGWPLLQLEYVHGSTLKHWIQRKRLSMPQAMNFAIQICKGMEYVSGYANLVHRDLKPSNLLIDDLNVLKATDLGISHPISDQDNIASTRRDYERGPGTPLYMSPEQFDNPDVNTRRSLIFDRVSEIAPHIWG